MRIESRCYTGSMILLVENAPVKVTKCKKLRGRVVMVVSNGLT